MKANWTPGPWHVAPSGPYIVDEFNQRVAQAALSECSKKEAEANARLIAACPESIRFVELLARFGEVYEAQGNNRLLANDDAFYALNTGAEDAVQITMGDLREARILLAKISGPDVTADCQDEEE